MVLFICFIFALMVVKVLIFDISVVIDVLIDVIIDLLSDDNNACGILFIPLCRDCNVDDVILVVGTVILFSAVELAFMVLKIVPALIIGFIILFTFVILELALLIYVEIEIEFVVYCENADILSL